MDRVEKFCLKKKEDLVLSEYSNMRLKIHDLFVQDQPVPSFVLVSIKCIQKQVIKLKLVVFCVL